MAYPSQSRGNFSGGSRPASDRIPLPQPVNYFDDPSQKKKPNKNLVSTDAERLAQDIKEVPASQIRRYYADVTTLARRIDLDENLTSEAIQSQMLLLKAKAVYGQKRLKLPDAFLQFFVDHGHAVKDKADFREFHRMFEAVIAYHKFYEIKQRN